MSYSRTLFFELVSPEKTPLVSSLGVGQGG
jgi:hypothetical protein